MSGTKWVLCVLAVAVLGCCFILAQDEADAGTTFNEGSYTYEVISGNDVQVNGFSSSAVANVVIPDSVSHSGTTYTVVKIKNSAFADKADITSVTIPDSVTEIESDVFKNCNKITSFQFGVGIKSGTISIGPTFKDINGDTITDMSKICGHHFAGTNSVLTRDSHLVTLKYEYSSTDKPTGYQYVLKDAKLQQPQVRQYYTVDKWYKKSDYTDPWNFNDTVTADMTLYGKATHIVITKITITNTAEELILEKGDTVTIQFTIEPSTAKKDVTLTSSDTSVASFKSTSQKQVLTANGHGTTVITVKANDEGQVSTTCTVTVVSGEDHAITVTTDGRGTAYADAQEAMYGEEITLTAIPSSTDYQFKEWQSTDVTIVNNRFIMPDKPVTVKAIFKGADIPITIQQPENGHIYGPSIIEKTTDGEFSVLADDGYIVKDILVDGKAAVSNQAVYILKNVTETHTITATFTAVEGAESEMDGEGNVTQTYQYNRGSIKLDVVEYFAVDGSAKYETEYDDAELGIEAELIEEIDTTGKSTGYGLCEVTYNAEKFDAAIKKAESIASALAHYRNVDTALAIDVTTATADKPINVALNIESYDGSYFVEIDGDIAKIGMDKTAMKFIKSKTNEMKVSVKIVDKKDMTAMQAWIVEDYKPYEIDINGIHSFDGKIRLAVPLVLGDQSKDNAAVYYVGLYHAEKVGGTYDEEDQIIEADLPHLSYYFAAVDYKESPTGKPSGFSIGIFAVFLILIILLLAAGVTFAMNYDVDSGKLYLKIPAKSKK